MDAQDSSPAPAVNLQTKEPLTLLTLPRELLEYIILWAHKVDEEDDDLYEDSSSEGDSVVDTSVDLTQTPTTSRKRVRVDEQGTHRIDSPDTPTKATGIAKLNLDGSQPAQRTPTPEMEIELGSFKTEGCIEALYCVNKELNEICRPIFWRRIDLEGEPNPALSRFRELALVKYAPHFREFYCRQSPDDEERNFKSDIDEQPKGWWRRKPRLHFMERFLAVVPHLEEIDIDIYGSQGPGAPIRNFTKLYRGIVRHRTTLTSLVLTSAGATTTLDQPWTATLVRCLPNLSNLSLQDLGPFDLNDALPLVVASLKRLDSLGISNSEVSSAWATLKLSNPLKVLELEDCADNADVTMESVEALKLTQDALEAFIVTNGNEVHTLRCDLTSVRNHDHRASPELDEIEEDEESEELKPFKLPKLRCLSFAGPTIGKSLIARFSPLPVTDLTIEYSFLLRASDFVALLRDRENFPQLKAFTLTERHNDDYADVLAQCAIRGIKCQLLPPDEDDEDDMFFDGSDDDEWDDEWDDDDGADSIIDMFGDEDGVEEWETDEEGEDSDEESDSEGSNDELDDDDADDIF